MDWIIGSPIYATYTVGEGEILVPLSNSSSEFNGRYEMISSLTDIKTASRYKATSKKSGLLNSSGSCLLLHLLNCCVVAAECD